MKVNVNLKNLLYMNDSKIYHSYRNGYILISFNISTKNNTSFTIKNINGLLWDNTNRKLILPNVINNLSLTNIENNNSTIPNFNRNLFSNISNYFKLDNNDQNSFLNNLLYLSKDFIVVCFPIDNNGNISNINFYNQGLNIGLEVDDNTTSIILNDITFQTYPYDTQCDRVITSYPNNFEVKLN